MDDLKQKIQQLINSGNFSEAESLLVNALNEEPDSTELLNLKADVYLKLGEDLWNKEDVENALDYFTQALEINPFNRDIVLKCGEILASLEQIESAENLYRNYLKKYEEDEKIQMALQELLSAHIKKSISEEINSTQGIEYEHEIKVSAIVSTYNSEKFIRGCLEDLINQTLYKKGGLEIIVVDSGSQQNEKDIVNEFQRKFKNIIYIRTENRETVYGAWNRGIKAAKGKYITNANTDDRHRHDALEIMSDFLDNNKDIALVYADVIITQTENETFEKNTPIGMYRWVDFNRESLSIGCYIGPQPMWRKSVHQQYGYFDESFTSSGDWEFWLRIAETNNFYHIPELLGLYLKSPQSVEFRNPEIRIQEDFRILNIYMPKYLSSEYYINQGIKFIEIIEQSFPSALSELKEKLLKLKMSLYSGSPDITRNFGASFPNEENIKNTRDFLPETKSLSDKEKVYKALNIIKKPAVNDSSKIYDQAEDYIKAGQYEDAIKLLEGMPDFAKNDPKRITLLATCKESSGRIDEAEKIIEEFLAVNQPSAELLNLKGYFLSKKGLIKEAEEVLIQATNIDEKFADAWVHLGALKWANGKQEEGFELLEKGFLLSPFKESIMNAYHSAAVSLSKLEREEKAFQKATKDFPENKKLKFIYIDILLQQEKYREAKEELLGAMVAFGINEDVLEVANALRDKVGPEEIESDSEEFRGYTVSLCMIVKNEEKHIAKCLYSISPLVDEIIVVDTGSKDKTKDIAKAFGAKVFDFQWNDNFAEARNFSLSKAKGDWILILDADEVISNTDFDKFRNLIKEYKDKKTAFSFTTRNYYPKENAVNFVSNDGSYKEEAGIGWYPTSKVRLFPRSDSIFFEKPAHELVEKSLIDNGYQIKGSDIPIHHYGKLDLEKNREKAEYYYQIRKSNFNENSDMASKDLLFLGLQAYELQKYEESLEYLNKLVLIEPDSAFAHQSLGDTLYKTGNYDKAFEAYKKAIELDPELRTIRSNILELCNECQNLIKQKNLIYPRLSVCMIVRNEEENIQTAINSIKDLSDEIIVVDTGSEDKTKDIAIASGAKVFDFQWNDNFAEARNFSLSKATGDWILILDADEVISYRDHSAIREIINNPENRNTAFVLTTRNYIDKIYGNWIENRGDYIEEKGVGWVAGEKVRLFPNDSRIFYENPVHEFIERSIENAGIIIKKCDVPVHHYGKLNPDKEKQKKEYYYNISSKKIDENKYSEVMPLYIKAAQANDLKKYEEALDYLSQVIKEKPDFTRALCLMGNALFHLGRFKEAIEVLRKAEELQPDFKEVLLIKANSEVYSGNIDSGIIQLNNLLALYPEDPMILIGLATAYLCNDEKEKAISYLQKLSDMQITYDKYLTDIADLLKKAGNRAFSEKILEPLKKIPYGLEIDSEQIDYRHEKTEKSDVEVSVIIFPTAKQKNLKKCLQSIIKHTPDFYEKIVVLRENSTHSKWLYKKAKSEKRIKIISAEKGKNFAEICNTAIRSSYGEYIALVSDNTIVTHDWLSGMLECYKNRKNIATVAPMSINVENIQLVTDDRYSSMDYLENFAKKFRETYRYCIVPVKNPASFCFLLKRDIFEKLGQFDKRYTSPDIVLEDFCLNASKEGLSNLIAGDVFVFLLEKLETTHELNKDIIISDRKNFTLKWRDLENREEQDKIVISNAILLAEELNLKGDLEKSVKVLLEGISIYPDEVRLKESLVRILIENKKFLDASDILNSFPENYKNTPQWIEFFAEVSEGLNEDEKALDYINKALEINENSSRALNLKAVLMIKKGNFEEAEKYLIKAIESDRSYSEPYGNLGYLKWKNGHKEQAFDLIERAFILSPYINQNILNYHTISVSLSRLEREEKIFRQASSLYSLNKRLKYTIVDILLQQEKYNEAMELSEDIILKHGPDEDFLKIAIRIREKVGIKEFDKSDPCTISLCMIVKNEEKNIGECLKKIRPAVDEIIVVDTGSSDKTKDIAKVFGAKLYDFKWNNDFAEARNFSLSKATGKWILILDADEVISPRDFNTLKQMVKVQGKEPVTYIFYTRNYVSRYVTGRVLNRGEYEEERGEGWFKSMKVRLFPNGLGIHFEDPVHELVEHSIMRKGLRIVYAPFPVHHYGKLHFEKVSKKGRDYIELAKKKFLLRGETDKKALYEYALQLSELGEHEEALKYWQKLSDIDPRYEKTMYYLGNTYSHLKLSNKAMNVLKQALEIEPESSDVILQLAVSEISCGYIEDAISRLKKLYERISLQPFELLPIVVAYFCLGNRNEGQKFLDKIYEIFSLRIVALGNYFSEFASILITNKQYKYALNFLEAICETKNKNEDLLTLLKDCRRIISDLETHGEKHIDETKNISVCMIVKNEEENIQNAINSIKELADEIIIVDTGSNDKTKEIAEKSGAKVFDFQWNNDFSDARNFSLSKATGKWIFILDADEVIAHSDIDKIKGLINEKHIVPVAYSFETRNYVPHVKLGMISNEGQYREEKGAGWLSSEKVRLFPNDIRIRFEFPVHEIVENSLKRYGIKIIKSEIPVHHYGLMQKKDSSKYERYYELSKKKLEEQGEDDLKALTELAVQVSALGKHEEALDYWQKALEIKPDFDDAIMGIGISYFALGKYSEAFEHLKLSVKKNGSASTITMFGTAAICCGEYQEAVSAMENLSEEERKQPLTLFTLAAASYLAGKKDRGDEYIKKLEATQFDFSYYFLHLAKLLVVSGKSDHAVNLLEAAISAGYSGSDIQQFIEEIKKDITVE